MESTALVIGAVYFCVVYEDDAYVRPLIKSYEYIGPNIYDALNTSQSEMYFFRFLGSDNTLELTERQLDIILDLPELIEVLKSWKHRTQSTNPPIAEK
jgi:hypothetical protein